MVLRSISSRSVGSFWWPGLRLSRSCLVCPTQVTFPLYVTIPVVIVYWGFTPDPKHARRRRLVAWMLAARYALVGHIPIVAGRRAGERGGVLTTRERIDVAAWWRTRVLHKDDEHLWESATKGRAPPLPRRPADHTTCGGAPVQLRAHADS